MSEHEVSSHWGEQRTCQGFDIFPARVTNGRLPEGSETNPSPRVALTKVRAQTDGGSARGPVTKLVNPDEFPFLSHQILSTAHFNNWQEPARQSRMECLES